MILCVASFSTTIVLNISIRAHSMKQPTIKCVIVLALCLFSSCGTSKQENSHTEAIKVAKENMRNDAPPPLPPGNCKVIATVESIDKALKGTGANDPCSKAPCSATVRIDSILGYGSAFPKPLVAGQIIQVTFANTLNPTKEMFPDIEPSLPGLRVKDTFAALISGSVAMASTEPSYAIYSYEKK
jgi:hypothetical protein